MQKTNNKRFDLSIVIPLYNEEEVIEALCDKLISFKEIFSEKTEVIFIDDGSSDETLSKLKKSSIKNTYEVTLIQLSRNFGHQAALLAGLASSRGEITVTMDGDLQHPIDLIPKMLSLHKNGIDVVNTVRIDKKKTPFFKKITSSLFYKLFRSISKTKILASSSDFRSMNRISLNYLLSMSESRKFLRGMVSWIGFSSASLSYEVGFRYAGVSKYSLKKMFKLSLEGIVSFSSLPLYLSVILGILSITLSTIYGLYILYAKYFLHSVVSGWTSLILIILIMSSFIFLLFALFGVYLAAIYDEVKNRPSYIIKSRSVLKTPIGK